MSGLYGGSKTSWRAHTLSSSGTVVPPLCKTFKTNAATCKTITTHRDKHNLAPILLLPLHEVAHASDVLVERRRRRLRRKVRLRRERGALGLFARHSGWCVVVCRCSVGCAGVLYPLPQSYVR